MEQAVDRMVTEVAGSGVSGGRQRYRRSIYRLLLVFMLAFGAVVGLLFPPFTQLALQMEKAMTPTFFGMCISAGLLVGVVNFYLFRVLVSREFVSILAGMKKINESVDEALRTDQQFQLVCKLEVDSDDVVGEVAKAFNDMSEAITARITRESLVRTLMADLSSNVDLHLVADSILEAFISITEVKGGMLYCLHGDELELVITAGLNESMRLPDSINELAESVTQAVKRGTVISLSPDERGVERLRVETSSSPIRPNFVLLVPLVAGSGTVGLIVLPCFGRQALTPERQQLVEIFRTHVAPYLQNALLHRKIGEIAALDWLTRILNRRFGMRRLREEFSRSLRHGIALSVVLLDIDHFKQVNDQYGHAAGDAVLREVANRLKQNIRSGEAVCRYGGEEFMVVAPGNDLHDASILCERLRKMIEEIEVRWAGQGLRVTISLGVATWPVVPASVVNEIISAADEALYFAKESGRNRVAVHRGDDVVLYTEQGVEVEEAALEKA